RELPHLAARRDVPDLERLVVARGERERAVRREGERGHAAVVRPPDGVPAPRVDARGEERADLAARRDLPEPDLLARAARERERAVGREGDGEGGGALVRADRADLAAGRDLADLERAVVGPEERERAVRREGDRVDGAPRRAERADLAPGCEVPEPRRPV